MNTFRHDRTSMENPGTSNSAYLPKVFTHNGDNSVCSSATPTPEIDVTASKIIPSELCCMLCRRVLCDPSILKSCLHRFCALCIKRCFSTGQRKCPHCGKISSSADPVIFDPNFSLLTSKLSNSPKRMMTPNNDGINGDNHNGTVGSKRLKSDNISLPPSSCSSRTRSNQLNGISKLTKFSMTMNSTSYIGIGDAGRISLCRSLTTWLQVILWPDGSVFRKTDMPRCLRRPRYIYIPPEATVAHVSEFLWKRVFIEANWLERANYRIELCIVEEERSEFAIWVYPSRSPKVPGLSLPGISELFDSGDSKSIRINELEPPPFALVVKPHPSTSNLNIGLFMRHPFQPLPPTKNLMDVQRSITNLTPIMNLNNGEEKPDQTLKLVYRFVPTKGQKENS